MGTLFQGGMVPLRNKRGNGFCSYKKYREIIFQGIPGIYFYFEMFKIFFKILLLLIFTLLEANAFGKSTDSWLLIPKGVCAQSLTKSLMLCLTLCDLMDCPPCSSVHGDSPGKNTGRGCHALLQGIFPTQGLNPGLPHCRQTLYCLSHQGSPVPKGRGGEMNSIQFNKYLSFVAPDTQVWNTHPWGHLRVRI